MRALNAQEQESVSGALLPEVPVRGRRIRDPLFDPLRTGFFGGDQYLDTLLMTQRPGVGDDDGGGGAGGAGATDDAGLALEQWVEIWADIFKNIPEKERSKIGNAMVTVGATQVNSVFTSSAGQFLSFLGAAVVKGDVASAAFYCDQLERTYLNKSSKDAILDALGSFGEVAKVFKERFVKKR
jgi:hypothetical protein